MPQKPTTLRKKITHPVNFTFGGHGSPYGCVPFFLQKY
jgi:hypothetical protein